MKINELLSIKDITNIEEIIETKKYISSPEKLRIAKATMDASVEFDRGYISFDSYKKYLAFIFAAIEAHTNLEFATDWNERVAEYDSLCENELLDAIINSFKNSYEACMSVLQMKCDDLLAENSVEASVAKIATSVSENLDVIIGVLSDKLLEIDLKKIIPEDMDSNKLQRLLNKFK